MKIHHADQNVLQAGRAKPAGPSSMLGSVDLLQFFDASKFRIQSSGLWLSYIYSTLAALYRQCFGFEVQPIILTKTRDRSGANA
jgi:hypothetical protein